MKPCIAILMALIIAGCQSTGSSNDSTAGASSADMKPQIVQALAQYREALMKRDLAALDRIWADDLQFINPHGQLLGKKDRLENLRTGATSFSEIEMGDPTVKTYGSGADAVTVVTTRSKVVARYSGRDVPGDDRVSTVWTRRSGQWQIHLVHMTPVAPK